METITIPSPSVFLDSPVIKPAPEPPPASPPPKRRSTTTAKPASAPKKQNGVTKPKQSKSRNGCITCKAKRLKCDETKPSCQQCHKRSVTCGGYKKNFKWRPFEEATFVNKPSAPRRAKRNSISSKPPEPAPVASLSPSDGMSTPDADADADADADEDVEDVSMQGPLFRTGSSTSPPFSNNPSDMFDQVPMFDMSTPPYMRELPRPRFDADHVTSSLSSLFEDPTPRQLSPDLSFSGQSPRLIDLLLPGSELTARPEAVTTSALQMPTSAISFGVGEPHFSSQQEGALESGLEGDIEEIPRRPQMSAMEMWMSRPQVPLAPRDGPVHPLYRQPEVPAGSPEMLMLRFDKQTCGILSVKDGPTENPWRTLIWPLARDSPALYHAIASMTAFHTSKEKPALRVDGMEHMRRSIRALATGIEKMRPDTALATTLALAFAESWDQHISTGIEHLRGARVLVNRALISHKKRSFTGDDLARLRFLCNTMVYMDVIARLTSVEDDETENFDHDSVVFPYSLPSPFQQNANEVDPLMGCASSLFPLIGRAANLCRRVMKVETNSIAIISQAMELKEAIEQWSPPPGTAFERPEDPTAEIQHALQTAEAYRYATLLHLHQAVPEIPSLTSAQLAKKVLVYLATVPLSSRLVIVQIYPLLAAGCEAWDSEDRQWVEERWQSMASRMWIGNIDRCWEVMQEVWSRRNQAEQAKAEQERLRRPRLEEIMHSESSKRKFEEEMALEEGFGFSDRLNESEMASKRQRSSFSGGFSGGFSSQGKRRQEPTTEMDPELTVRGGLHWAGVMKDWNWEILLG